MATKKQTTTTHEGRPLGSKGGRGGVAAKGLTVRSAVAHHQVRRLALEVADDLLGRRHLRRHGGEKMSAQSREARRLSLFCGLGLVTDYTEIDLDLIY